MFKPILKKLFLMPLLVLLSTYSCGGDITHTEASRTPSATTGPWNESKEEQAFRVELARIIAEHKVNICYYLGNASYFLEHLVPLYHVYPAKFCGLPESRERENISLLGNTKVPADAISLFAGKAEMQSYLEGPKNIMLGCSGLSSAFSNTSRYQSLGHGIDADSMYYDDRTFMPGERPCDDISLVFTKYLESTYATPAEILSYYNADPSRKTVLFLPTEGILEFIDKRAPQPVREKAMQELLALKDHYNVIVRPHPLLDDALMAFYKKNFIVAPPGKFPSFVPLFDAADVILATPAGGGSTATSRPEKPMVLLRPRVLWKSNGVEYGSADDISQRNFAFTLNESNTVLQKDINIDYRARIEEALNDFDAEKKIEGRKDYFDLWFGCIDGYEEYRVFMEKVLPMAKIPQAELDRLWELYQEFPRYKNRNICRPGN